MRLPPTVKKVVLLHLGTTSVASRVQTTTTRRTRKKKSAPAIFAPASNIIESFSRAVETGSSEFNTRLRRARRKRGPSSRVVELPETILRSSAEGFNEFRKAVPRPIRVLLPRLTF